MRIAVALSLIFAACTPTPAPAPAPAPTTPSTATPGPDATPTPSPAPAITAAPTPAPTVAEPIVSPPEPDDKTLEKSPGLTPALPLVRAAYKSNGMTYESPAMGPDSAHVKVFVYSDFQCPVCRRAVEPLKKLARDDGDVQIIWRNHPLAMHDRADPAARAAMAAFRQGKFWEMHDRLFESRALSDAELRSHAEGAGLDMAKFDKDLADPTLAAQIAAESAQAEALDAQGTPAFFVNGDKTVGWGSMIGLKYQIDQARTAGAGKSAEAATAAKDAASAKILFGE